MKFTPITAVALSLGALVPTAAFAATIPDVLKMSLFIIQDLIMVVIGAAVLVFIWGVLKYVLAADDFGKKQGRTWMLWGIIALFVMVALWGLVWLLRESFGLGQSDTVPNPPEIVTNAGRDASAASTVQDVVKNILGVLEAIGPVLIGLGVLFFLWGVLHYVHTENAKDKAKASSYIAWGIGFLFVLTTVWGLVYMIGQTVGINTQQGTSVQTTTVSPQSLIKEKGPVNIFKW
jgi:uncharacterized membrane protein YidH (DUF202 family)